MLKQRSRHLNDINKQSNYKKINITEANSNVEKEPLLPSQLNDREIKPESETLELSKSETNLSLILRKRLENIEHELTDFNDILLDFS